MMDKIKLVFILVNFVFLLGEKIDNDFKTPKDSPFNDIIKSKINYGFISGYSLFYNINDFNQPYYGYKLGFIVKFNAPKNNLGFIFHFMSTYNINYQTSINTIRNFMIPLNFNFNIYRNSGYIYKKIIENYLFLGFSIGLISYDYKSLINIRTIGYTGSITIGSDYLFFNSKYCIRINLRFNIDMTGSGNIFSLFSLKSNGMTSIFGTTLEISNIIYLW